MTNSKIASILKQISIFLAMDEVPFKPEAYEEASYTVLKSKKSLSSIYQSGGREALDELPGIGEAISEKIEILLKTNKLPYYEKLKKKYPIDVISLSNIEGIGPKTIKKLYRKLGVKTMVDLERAIKRNQVKKIKGFGEKTAQNILDSIYFSKKRIIKKEQKRFIFKKIYPQIKKILKKLKSTTGVKRLEAAGSVRRKKETIGDLDMVGIAKNPAELMKALTSLENVEKVLAKGKTKTMVRVKNGLEVDLRVVPEKSFGAAMLYFTGPRHYTIEIRRLALKQGYTLNEYGLYTNDKQKKYIAGRTEKDIYQALGLEYLPPQMRENAGVKSTKV